MGDSAQAVVLAEQALAIAEARYAQDHEDVAADNLGVGLARWAAGDHEGAVCVLQRSIAIYTRLLGPEHPDIAMPTEHLARLQAGVEHPDR